MKKKKTLQCVYGKKANARCVDIQEFSSKKSVRPWEGGGSLLYNFYIVSKRQDSKKKCSFPTSIPHTNRNSCKKRTHIILSVNCTLLYFKNNFGVPMRPTVESLRLKKKGFLATISLHCTFIYLGL